MSFLCTSERDLYAMLARLFPTNADGDMLKYCVCEVTPFEGKIRYTIKFPNIPTFELWQREWLGW